LKKKEEKLEQSVDLHADSFRNAGPTANGRQVGGPICLYNQKYLGTDGMANSFISPLEGMELPVNHIKPYVQYLPRLQS